MLFENLIKSETSYAQHGSNVTGMIRRERRLAQMLKLAVLRVSVPLCET
jgi:hypothetical protein